MRSMSPIEDNMTDIIIERLHELGFKDTEGKSQRELIQILAAMDVKVDSPNNSWF